MPQPASPVAPPPSPTLSASQLATLAELGEERTADVGEVLYQVGDRRYPFIAILEGEVVIRRCRRQRDRPSRGVGLPRRAEPAVRTDGVRHGGRHRAAALHRRRARGAALAAVRGRPAERSRARRPSSPGAKRSSGSRGIGLEIVGPHSSEGDHADARLRPQQPPAVHLARPRARRRSSGGGSGRGPRRGEPAPGQAAGRRRAPAARRPARSPARSGSASSSRRGRRSTCSWSAPAPPASAPPSTALPRASTRSSSTAPGSAARPARRAGSRTTSGSRPGSPAPS